MRLDALNTAVSIGFETLRANPLRTILSTLGVIIGVSPLVAVLSVGDGMEQSLREQISNTTDLEAISIRPRTMEEVDGQSFPITNPVRLTPDEARQVRAVEGVRGVLYTHQAPAEVRSPFGLMRRMAIVSAEVALMDSVPAPGLEAGRRLLPDELPGDANVVVISHDLAIALSEDSTAASAVGAILTVGDAPAEVVGVLDSASAPRLPGRRNAGDYRVQGTAGFVDRVLSTGRPVPATIVALSQTVEHTAAVRARIEAWFATRDSAKARQLAYSTNERRLEQLSTAITMFKLFLGAITGISLLVGGIGIMNVLLSSVTERTREIGIRKATGAQDRDIKWQFLAESVAISGVGSLIGLVVGVAGAFGITAVIRNMSEAPFLTASISWSTVAVAVLAAVIVGLAFGTYPARRAARLSPIDAIRHE